MKSTIRKRILITGGTGFPGSHLPLTGLKYTITLKQLPSDDPMQRCPAVTPAKSSLGWQPTADLEKDLMAAVRHLEAATNAV